MYSIYKHRFVLFAKSMLPSIVYKYFTAMFFSTQVIQLTIAPNTYLELLSNFT